MHSTMSAAYNLMSVMSSICPAVKLSLGSVVERELGNRFRRVWEEVLAFEKLAAVGEPAIETGNR